MRFQIVKLVNLWDVIGKILREIQRETRTALNKTIQLCWEWQGFSAKYKKLLALNQRNGKCFKAMPMTESRGRGSEDRFWYHLSKKMDGFNY